MELNSNSQNLREYLRVYLDCEFSDFVKMDLISIGLAANNGSTCYGENQDFNKNLSSSFVKANIYPLLNPELYSMPRARLSATVWQWIDDLPTNNVIIMVDNHDDWKLLNDLLEVKHPKISHMEDIFANIRNFCTASTFMMGQSEQEYVKIHNAMIKVFVNEFRQYFDDNNEIHHHALSDAKANLRGYTRVCSDFGMMP